MRQCSKCAECEDKVSFPQAGLVCRACKAKALRELKFTDPLYYKKRKEYREKNKVKINNQKKESYLRNVLSTRERTKNYYALNRDKCTERQRLYQERVETASAKSWLMKCLKHARAADKRLKRPFDIDIDYLLRLYDDQKGLCAITNVLMTHKRNDLFAISIDRIESGGHTKGNVQLVCQAINLAKRERKNSDILSFLATAFKEYEKIKVLDFDGFNYPESTFDYNLAKKQIVIDKLKSRIQTPFIPPSYSDDLLKEDFDRIKKSNPNAYLIEGKWRSHAPSNQGFAGKLIIRHFHPHLWNVRVSDKPTIPEAWKGGKIFDKAAWNLVNGKTKISFDRIIREFIFAGAGLVSQLHPGFAKAIYAEYTKPKSLVYDPFGGWGGRLLGAHANGLKYVACEMSKPTYEGLVNMSKHINYDCTIINADYLTVNIDADFMFTSPPFGTEFYIGSHHIIDFDKFLEHTKGIKTRILHVNYGIYQLLKDKCIKSIPIQARIRANSEFSNEYLIFV